MKRLVYRLLTTAAMFIAATAVVGQPATWPSRAITIIDAYPPGGSTDVLARLIGKRLGEILQQPVVVESRPGAGGIVGTAALSRADPDGYSYLIAHPGLFTIAPSIFPNVHYDPIKDFKPVMTIIKQAILFCVPGSSAVSTVQELTAAAQTPGELNFGIPGSGSLSHLVAVMFGREAGVQFTFVPYRGVAPLAVALSSGEVDVGVFSAPDAKPHLESGRIRCIVTTAAQRATAYPDIPTMADEGFPNVVGEMWLGLMAPAGTPEQVVSKLYNTVSGILEEPAIRKRLQDMGMEPWVNDSTTLSGMIVNDFATYGEIIEATNMKME